ncbi:MAG: hypothetical protein KGO96_02820 [Elusimicrobia bacterium]|nr:hypothetical protein [Elusimicrobiota bacterium]MDE2424826.1 hypothetical protein [Elusimicrobiota bacterium]
MTHRALLALTLALSHASPARAPAPGRSAAGLVKVADLPLPGPAGRFDYEAFDASTGRLYINQMGAGRVLVYDARRRRVVADLPGFPGATGITLAPESGLAFVSAAGSLYGRALGRGSVRALRLSDLSTIAVLPAGGFPDGSAWVAPLRRLFVSNERGGRETVIGGLPPRVLKTLPLGGEAGNSAYDPDGRRVLVNVQTRRELALIDPRALTIVRRVALPESCDHNHGLLVDEADHAAFVACDGNARLLTLSLPDLRVVQVDETGGDPDVLALDSARRLLYVAAESGVATVFSVRDGRPKRLWRGWVGPDAHSVAVDPATGLAYFPLADAGGRPRLRVMRFTAPGN